MSSKGKKIPTTQVVSLSLNFPQKRPKIQFLLEMKKMGEPSEKKLGRWEIWWKKSGRTGD